MFRRTLPVVAAILAVTAGPAAAQKAPEFGLSWDPNLPAGDAPAKAKLADRLTVRPNQSEAYYLYVHNPNDAPKTYTVVVAKGTGAGDELARQSITVDPEKTLRVPFAAPATPPPAPAAAGQPAAPPANPAKRLDGQLVVRLINPTTGKDAAPAKTVFTTILPLANYIDEEKTTAVYSRARNRLEVTVAKKKGDAGAKSEFEGRPCKVKLTLRPDLIKGLVAESVSDGTFEAELSDQGPDSVTLLAENLRFVGDAPEGLVGVAVDGVDRALVYTVTFAADNTTGTRLTFDRAKPRLVPVNGLWVAAPGKPFPVRIEVDAVPASDQYRLAAKFDRAGTNDPNTAQPLLRRDAPVRDDSIAATVGAADGAIVLQAARADWVVAVDTAGVVGKRSVTATITKPDGGFVDGNKETLVLDRTAPVNVTLALPKAGERGTVIKATASGLDAESGVARVYFFVGDPPAADGKAAPGGKVVAKSIVPASPEKVDVTADVPLPDVKGLVQVGVRVVNVLGMTTDKVEEVDVTDPPKKDKEAGATTGTVKGLIAQGGGSQVRPQPGLKVELRGPDGKAVKSTTTNDEGKFEFKDVPPGDYKVFSTKPVDANAKGEKGVTVEAGKTAEVTVFLLR